MAGIHENGGEAPTNSPSATAQAHNVRSTVNPEVPRNPPSGTFFGLNRNQLHSWGVGVAPRDYKARYPPDPYGQEMSDNARIWPIYLEEAADFDANMLAEWRDTIDVLLVFAGLFSAVLTTFVVQTSQNMQPDYNQTSTFLLFELLKATMSNGSQSSLPSSPASSFSPSPSDEWINSLWFVSLTLSLITALVAVLVKQWLHQYVAVVSDSSARDRARIRHMRFAGLQTWQVPMIIGLLPVLLHVSLALFFAGLSIFLFSLNMKVAWLVSIIGAATYTAYVIALILPLVYPYCPYKVPLTFFTHRLYQFVNNCLIPRVVLVLRYPYTRMFRHDDHSHLPGSNDWLQDFLKSRQRKGPTLKEMELTHVQENAAKVDAQLLLWLHSSTSNTSVDESVLQAFAGMPSSTCEHLPAEYISALVISLAMHVEPLVTLSPDTDRELELYYRACLVLRPYSWLGIFPQCDQIADQCSNEQLKVLLHSRNPEKAPTVLLEILRGPQRSSLPLHSVVWKTLVDVAISSRSAALELELELMKSLATFPSTSESGDVTTIDKPTYELRRRILDKLSEHWGYDHTRIPVGINSVHLDTIIVLVSRIQQRFRNFIYVPDRKRLIEASLASLAIIEHTHLLIPILDWKEVNTVLDVLYSLLSSDIFTIVGDLEALVRRIFMIFDEHRSWFEHSIRMRSHSPTNRQFFSITYQCYLRSLADGDEKLENDTILPILEHFLSFCLRMYHDSDSHGILAFSKFYPLVLLRHEDEQIWDLFRIDSLVEVMLLLIKGHNESILYEWAQLPVMRRVWPRCLRRLVQWSLAERFRQWDFLKRVLTIVVIGELRNMLGYGDDKESLPRYDYEPYTAVANQLPWLHEVQVSSSGSSSDGEPNAVEYSQVAAHPKFQEFLNSVHPLQEDVANAYSHLRPGIQSTPSSVESLLRELGQVAREDEPGSIVR